MQKRRLFLGIQKVRERLRPPGARNFQNAKTRGRPGSAESQAEAAARGFTVLSTCILFNLCALTLTHLFMWYIPCGSATNSYKDKHQRQARPEIQIQYITICCGHLLVLCLHRILLAGYSRHIPFAAGCPVLHILDSAVHHRASSLAHAA